LVTIQQTELKDGIQKAHEVSKKDSSPVLLSEVHKIDYIDPFLFFERGNKKYAEERFFWKDHSDEKYIVGLGICIRIESDQAADRFFHVEREWKDLLEKAIICDDYHIEGTGPTAFGGFSFDPLKDKTILWSKFSHSVFHIPKYMLSVINGQTYLTANILVNENDDLSLYWNFEHERKELINSACKAIEYSPFNQIKKEEINPEEWQQTVNSVVHDLKNGPQKKVVLARELRLHFDKKIQSGSVLNKLLMEQSESYVFAFESKGDCFIGASPERLVKKEKNQIYSTCLAGSIARGKDEAEDKMLGETLLKDDKNLSEHQFVVEMIKEAIEDTCSEVVIPDHPQLLKLRHIQHLFTPVKGKPKKDTSLLMLAERLHPTPALGGLPKKSAVLKIREVEDLDRGLYGGPLGWFDYQGNGEFAVAIRSGLIQGSEASIFAGCGVVADSVAELEYQETNIKFKPMLSALGGL
jgi:menaquinone-specific isochorismate synthase